MSDVPLQAIRSMPGSPFTVVCFAAFGTVGHLMCFKAAENFQHELTALRRSFRFNEYEAMEAPRNPVAKVMNWIQGAAALPLQQIQHVMQKVCTNHLTLLVSD
jgi:hypothetical protein